MKKILLTALCGILLGASQVNAKDFIVPYQLTEQDSGGYHFVNLASEKVFKNLIPRIRIDTRKISDTYNENLIPNKQNNQIIITSNIVTQSCFITKRQMI